MTVAALLWPAFMWSWNRIRPRRQQEQALWGNRWLARWIPSRQGSFGVGQCRFSVAQAESGSARAFHDFDRTYFDHAAAMSLDPAPTFILPTADAEAHRQKGSRNLASLD
jgi:hypothetical protein